MTAKCGGGSFHISFPTHLIVSPHHCALCVLEPPTSSLYVYNSLHKKKENIENLLCMRSLSPCLWCRFMFFMSHGGQDIQILCSAHEFPARARTHNNRSTLLCTCGEWRQWWRRGWAAYIHRSYVPRCQCRARRNIFSELRKVFGRSFSPHIAVHNYYLYAWNARCGSFAISNPNIPTLRVCVCRCGGWMDGWMVEPKARDARDATTCRDNVALLCMMRVQHCYL